MDDPGAVQRRQPARHLPHDGPRLRLGERPAPLDDEVEQAAARKELQDELELGRRLVRIEQRDQRRVPQLRHCAEHLQLARQLGLGHLDPRQQLDGDALVEPPLAEREPHLGELSAAEPRLEQLVGRV